MSGAGRRHPADRHVIVPDRLDLLDPDILCKLVEFTEDQVEAADDFKRLHARSDLSEADHIGKNDCGVLKMIGDAFGSTTQTIYNLGWKHIPEEVLGVALLLLDLYKIG